MTAKPKATSVNQLGQPDGWEPVAGFRAELDHSGGTRLVVSVPPAQLPKTHLALIRVLKGPLGVLYRQKVDRKKPRPEGAPDKDFVALDVPTARLEGAIERAAGLIYEDARHELWLRGRLNEQVVLDGDGLVYCYPDDPAFRDALQAAGVAETEVVTMLERDYVKHWFFAANDGQELGLIQELQMTDLSPLRG